MSAKPWSGKELKKEKASSHYLPAKALHGDLGTELYLRLNSIDYTFHFPKCHLPEGAGGVFGIHLADILAMWLSASAGRVINLRGDDRESLTAEL